LVKIRAMAMTTSSVSPMVVMSGFTGEASGP
jgi:hypothetical protein